MLPPGHIAAGALVGASRARRVSAHPMLPIAAGIAVGVLPDFDVFIPRLLDRAGIEHRLQSGRHHSWVTHTPLFWGLIGAGAIRGSRHPWAPSWAPEAARILSIGSAVHLAQDTVANTLALFWPVRRREYGLQLDRLPGVTDHADYARRYPFSPAGQIEALLIFAAGITCARRLSDAA